MSCAREYALYCLGLNVLAEKISAVKQYQPETMQINTQSVFAASDLIPGRPYKPELVDPRKVPSRSIGTVLGRAALMHSIAHIEFNAINLALDMIWRFPQMPELFYHEWWRVAQEEAYHFSLIRTHLQTLGYDYGDFAAHNGLWDMAAKTADNLLARLGLVPRTLEARGLDVTPVIQEKLRQVGDHEAVALLDIILRDEVGHVEIGNRWFKQQCELAQREPVACYAELLAQYAVANPRGPFNWPARQAAGFSEAEIAWLKSL